MYIKTVKKQKRKKVKNLRNKDKRIRTHVLVGSHWRE